MSVVVRSMTPEAARACADRIKKGLDGIRADVLLLYEHEGWRALGYGSWRECVVQEFEHSERHLYRLLSAAQVDQNVQEIDPWVKTLPERQTRELQVLAPAEQQLVWQAVKATAPNGEPTAAHVRSLVTVAQDLERAGAIDDGTGEMVPWVELTPNRKLALLKANAAEETYERNIRQDERIKERIEAKNSQGQWKDHLSDLEPADQALVRDVHRDITSNFGQEKSLQAVALDAKKLAKSDTWGGADADQKREMLHERFSEKMEKTGPAPKRKPQTTPDDLASLKQACLNLIEIAGTGKVNSFVREHAHKNLETVNEIMGRFLA